MINVIIYIKNVFPNIHLRVECRVSQWIAISTKSGQKKDNYSHKVCTNSVLIVQ